MDYKFHTHTWLCSHATGTEEEYLIQAMENGIRYMGFSDHIPFRCDDGYEAKGIRIPITFGGRNSPAVDEIALG